VNAKYIFQSGLLFGGKIGYVDGGLQRAVRYSTSSKRAEQVHSVGSYRSSINVERKQIMGLPARDSPRNPEKVREPLAEEAVPEAGV
jgi:hypothetical protein